MFSKEAKRALVVALGYRTKEADEFETALFSKQPISDILKRNIIDIMASKPEALEVIHCLETSGIQPLSAHAQKRLRIAVSGFGNIDARALLSEMMPLMLSAPPAVPFVSLINSLMGASSNFEILGNTTVTNTGTSAVTGDVGVSPGTAITGFPPGVISGGSQHSNDAPAIAAHAKVVSAYSTLAAMPGAIDESGIDLGTLTLSPGVYSFSSSAGLTGTLHLDAGGDPNAQWVFQIGSTLTTATSSSVVFVGGVGSSDNVCWAVGSSATLGTSTSFIGNIVAATSITMVTSASVKGRLLARDGAVTLDTNIALNP
jgi:hypothetical protein